MKSLTHYVLTIRFESERSDITETQLDGSLDAFFKGIETTIPLEIVGVKLETEELDWQAGPPMSNTTEDKLSDGLGFDADSYWRNDDEPEDEESEDENS
jgi:hypothetical protein